MGTGRQYDEELKQYFTQDITGYYFDKKRNGYFLKGVAGVKQCVDRTRNDKAIKQAELSPVPFCKVYSYINEFLKIIRKSNGFIKNLSSQDKYDIIKEQ